MEYLFGFELYRNCIFCLIKNVLFGFELYKKA